MPPSAPVPTETVNVDPIVEVREIDGAGPGEETPASTATESLVAMLKHLQSIAKDGHVDEAHRQYAELFASKAFVMCRHEDQRPEKATGIYKKALEIERERDPGSDLFGTLMRRVSEL